MQDDISFHALHLLGHIIKDGLFYIKDHSDNEDYIIKNFLTNKQFWKAANELVNRNFISISNFHNFEKFYNTHVRSWTISWFPGEYEKLSAEPTILGAWIYYNLKSIDNSKN